MTPPKPSFVRATIAALLVTSPVLIMALVMAPYLYLPTWSHGMMVGGWLGFGLLAGQKTLQKMAGDAGPRWWSNFARSVHEDVPKRQR